MELNNEALLRLTALFKRQILASPLNDIVKLFVQRREAAAFTANELRSAGWNLRQLEKAGWVHYDGSCKRWKPWGQVAQLLYNGHPVLDGLFTEIPRPAGSFLAEAGQNPVIEVIGALDGGKMSPSNAGVIRQEIPFYPSSYRLNRGEFELFLQSLDSWVQAVIEWRKSMITPPFTNSERLTKVRDEMGFAFLKKYGNAARALWFDVPQFNPGGVAPFFNPVYFPRNEEDMSYFWRLVDLVNKLLMVPPVGDPRGNDPGWTIEQYLEIARSWLQGEGDVKISRRFNSSSHGTDTTKRIERARLSMGLRRKRRKK